MKRFTETNKWRDPWFRPLPANLKLFWLYLCDECDNAGFWDPDMDLARFIIGAPLVESEVIDAFKDRVEVTKNGKWRLTKFIQFQFGPLKDTNPCHKGVFKILSQRGFEGPQLDLFRGLQAPQVQDKEKDKEKERGGTGGESGNGHFKKPSTAELELHASKIGLPTVEVKKFLSYYESNGWRVGKNPMKCWRSAMTGWRTRWEEQRGKAKYEGPNI